MVRQALMIAYNLILLKMIKIYDLLLETTIINIAPEQKQWRCTVKLMVFTM